MQKGIFSGILLLFSIGMLQAEVEVEALTEQFSATDPGKGICRVFRFRNQLNHYDLTFQWLRASQKRDEAVIPGLRGPSLWYGFPHRSSFFILRVNKISNTVLEPGEFRIFREKERSGVRVLYNFDGVRITAVFSMRENSPLLFLDLIPEAGSDPVHSMTFDIFAYPSFIVKDTGRYQRVVRTPERELKADKGTQVIPLSRNEAILDLMDAELEPAKVAGAYGPCTVVVDWASVLSGNVRLGKVYFCKCHFVLNTKAKRWRFGFFEYRAPMSNADYLRYREQNAAGFLIQP